MTEAGGQVGDEPWPFAQLPANLFPTRTFLLCLLLSHHPPQRRLKGKDKNVSPYLLGLSR